MLDAVEELDALPCASRDSDMIILPIVLTIAPFRRS